MGNQLLVHEQLRELEEKLLQTEVRKSVKDLAILIADDFMEYGSSGNTYNKKQLIDRLSTAPIDQMTLLNFQVKLLSSSVALATYGAVQYGERLEETKNSLRSSIWRLKEGEWQIVFHQGTPAIAL